MSAQPETSSQRNTQRPAYFFATGDFMQPSVVPLELVLEKNSVLAGHSSAFSGIFAPAVLEQEYAPERLSSDFVFNL